MKRKPALKIKTRVKTRAAALRQGKGRKRIKKNAAVSDFIKSFSINLAIIALIAGMNWPGIFAIGRTLAYYNDTETSSDNAHIAGSLDFSLSSDDWDPPSDLEPSDTVTRHMSVMADDSVPFQYKIKAVKIDGDEAFCDALDLVATRGNEELYNGDLMDFDLTHHPVVIDEGGQDDWTFEITLPDSSGHFDEVSCEFRFDADGWQIGFSDGTSGFSDHEELENILESAVMETEEGLDNISSIADAYVNENHPDDNEGGSQNLKIRSQSGGKNRRTFIRFDFHFPAGASIQSAALKLFLDDAPSASRTYAVARALSSWSEQSITWNNQPATSSPATDSLSIGTTNDIWRSWNVTDDVADFVAGTFSNYGWGLSDIAENSATSREGKFNSREEHYENKRPVLEIAFSAPPATTAHLVINEVYYDVGHGKGSEGTNEWVELYNPTGSDIDIKNWRVCDASSCDIFATTSPSILIPSHGFAVVTPNASTWTKWAIPAGTAQIVLGSSIGGGLANAGNAVILKNASNVEIDAMSYGSNTSKLSPAVPKSGEGNSLARIVKGYDADLANDWIINATPNPGTNPSDSGVEIIRFTDGGVEVADYATGLNPLAEGDDSDNDAALLPEVEEVDEFTIQPAVETETASSSKSATEPELETEPVLASDPAPEVITELPLEPLSESLTEQAEPAVEEEILPAEENSEAPADANEPIIEVVIPEEEIAAEPEAVETPTPAPEETEETNI